MNIYCNEIFKTCSPGHSAYQSGSSSPFLLKNNHQRFLNLRKANEMPQIYQKFTEVPRSPNIFFVKKSWFLSLLHIIWWCEQIFNQIWKLLKIAVFGCKKGPVLLNVPYSFFAIVQVLLIFSSNIPNYQTTVRFTVILAP